MDALLVHKRNPRLANDPMFWRNVIGTLRERFPIVAKEIDFAFDSMTDKEVYNFYTIRNIREGRVTPPVSLFLQDRMWGSSLMGSEDDGWEFVDRLRLATSTAESEDGRRCTLRWHVRLNSRDPLSYGGALVYGQGIPLAYVEDMPQGWDLDLDEAGELRARWKEWYRVNVNLQGERAAGSHLFLSRFVIVIQYGEEKLTILDRRPMTALQGDVPEHLDKMFRSSPSYNTASDRTASDGTPLIYLWNELDTTPEVNEALSSMGYFDRTKLSKLCFFVGVRPGRPDPFDDREWAQLQYMDLHIHEFGLFTEEQE